MEDPKDGDYAEPSTESNSAQKSHAADATAPIESSVSPPPVEEPPQSTEFDWSRVRNKKEIRKKRKEERAAREAEAKPKRPVKKSEIAAVAAGVIVIASVAFFINQSDELRTVISADEAKRQKEVEQQADRALLSELISKHGADHPRVKQLRIELGDVKPGK